MKTTPRILSLAIALAIAGLVAPTVGAKEEKTVGSIRINHKVAPADLPSLAKISYQQALHAALAESPGSVIKGELEVEDGNLMYSFEIVGSNKKITEVEIDAGTGKPLQTENEEDEKKDEDKK